MPAIVAGVVFTNVLHFYNHLFPLHTAEKSTVSNTAMDF